jgi:hypothetical protein
MKGVGIYLQISEEQRLILYQKYYEFHTLIEQTELDFSKLNPNIIELDLSNIKYHYPLDNLPPQIISLVLNWDYNYPLDNLPCNLKQLLLGGEFNQPLDYLPETLKILKIGFHYSYDLLNLPKSLTTLIIHSHNIRNINLDLPNLTTLHLDYIIFDNNTDNNDNANCNLNNQLINLNKTLKELVLSSNISSNVNKYIDMHILEKFCVLETLHIGNYNNRINKFPPNLKHLIFDNYNYVLDNLPDTVEILEIGYESNLDLNYLPKNLKILDMGENITCNILVKYPESLEELKIIETHPQKYKLDLLDDKLKITMTTDYEAREKYYEDMKLVYGR